MKIISNSFAYSPKYFSVDKKQEKNISAIQNHIEAKVPVETLKAYSFGRAVSKRDDIYSDTSKFSEYFEDKLKKQMQVKSKEDIQNIIDNTIKKTNADEKTVCEVLSRVVQFGDFSSLDDLEMSIREKGYDGCHSKFYGALSLSLPFNYLFQRDQFMNKPKGKVRSDNPVSFIDNSIVDYIKTLDKNSVRFKENKEFLKSSVIIDGWNTKIDGKNMAYTMFGHENDLETITTSIIKEMQKTGKLLDEVLNGDIIKELKGLFGEDYEPVVIKSSEEPTLTAEAIANRIEPKMPTKEQIENFVDVVADSAPVKNIDKDSIKKLICKYLDVTFEAYSTNRINSELKSMHKVIENKVKQLGKTMNDVVYIYPQKDKSFSLISYQYALANNIPFDKFKEDDGQKPYYFNVSKNDMEKNKVYVILDDVAASGESLWSTQFDYSDFLHRINYDKNTNIIFAPLHSSRIGTNFLKSVITDENRKNIDFVLSSQVKGWEHNLNDNFSKEDIFYIEDIVAGKGFNSVGTSVVFPFCVTDSDTRLSALFSTFFIRYPNEYKISKKITEGWGFKNTFFKMTRDIGSYNEFDACLF